MATNVCELNQYGRYAANDQPLADRVTIRSRAGILPAAEVLARDMRARGLRLMVWHDLATLDPMTDADGNPLNARVFGWSAAELTAWQCHEAALHNPVFRAARLESEPFCIGRDGLTKRWANPLLTRIALDDFAERTGTPAAIVVPALACALPALLRAKWTAPAAPIIRVPAVPGSRHAMRSCRSWVVRAGPHQLVMFWSGGLN